LAELECATQTVRSASIRCYEIFIAPLFAQDGLLEMIVCNRRNSVIRVVCSHDAVRTSIDDRAFERREPCSAELTLAAVYGSSVEALLRRRETRKVLHGCSNFLALNTLDVVVAKLSREVAIFSVRLFDPTVAELAC
jgi:hypothetical protein